MRQQRPQIHPEPQVDRFGGLAARLDRRRAARMLLGGAASAGLASAVVLAAEAPAVAAAPSSVHTAQIEDFWQDSDGADWSPAIRRALDSVPAPGGFTLLFGRREYTFSETIVLDRSMHLMGAGGGRALYTGTVFSFPRGVLGIHCRSFADLTNLSADPRSSTGAVIENINLSTRPGTAQPSPNPDAHGVLVHAPVTLLGMMIAGFEGDGIRIFGDHGYRSNGQPDNSNANGWRIANCAVVGCGGHGLLVDGPDANAGTAEMLIAVDNGQWAIRDRSALGNTYVACLAERSASRPDVGAIRCDEHPDCRSVFISPYVEGYTVAYSVNGPALLIGGRGGGFRGTASWLAAKAFGAVLTPALSVINSVDPALPVTTRLGSADRPHVALQLLQGGDSRPYAIRLDRLSYSDPANPTATRSPVWWSLVWESALPLRFSVHTLDAAGQVTHTAGQLSFPNGYYTGESTGLPTATTVRGVHTRSARTFPVANDAYPPPMFGGVQRWELGDRVLNTAPSPAQPYAGWICVTAGNPGTWKPFGRIEF